MMFTSCRAYCITNKTVSMEVYSDDRKLPKGWEFIFLDMKKDITQIIIKLNEIHRESRIYPNITEIFNAFYLTPLPEVRVVIIGQEPYHNEGQANGLAFSVNKGFPIPPSLSNVFTEIKNEIEGFSYPSHGDLTKWAKQGVLLLNASLTVEKTREMPHSIMWEGFVRKCIKACSDKKKVIFLLWGREAKSLDTEIDYSTNIVLKCAHPSPHSANRGFFNCGHFKKVSELLGDSLDWNV